MENDDFARFYLERTKDISEVSGLGRVADGVQFPDGTCVLRWRVGKLPQSHGVYPNIEAVEQIHGHNGSTTVQWLD